MEHQLVMRRVQLAMEAQAAKSLLDASKAQL
jgi:hypothetical protein